MSRQLTPSTSLDLLKREAKRWLKRLRANDSAARARLENVYPGASSTPGLRHIQHAIALEHGVPSWARLKSELADRLAHREGASRPPALADLIDAARRGDLSRTIALIDAHPDLINERGGEGTRTALHVAAIARHEPVVKALVERGADPNIRCEGDSATPLHFAAENGHAGIIQALIEHGADPIGEGDYHELDVIGWATCFGSGQKDIVDYLLAHGAEHNMFSAVAMGETGVIESLAARSRGDLERRMDLANRRRRPLHLAVVKKQPAALQTLLELGAKTESLDEGGFTALDQAAMSGETEMAHLLVDRGAKIRMPAAIALPQMDDVERLLREDPDCLKPGYRWGDLIVRASECAPGRVIELLIHRGASVDVRDDPKTAVDSTSGYTPLHAAGFFGNADAAAVLLAHGANVNAREERYCGTPAGWANYAGHTQVRDLIVGGPIDVFEAIDRDVPARIPGILQRDSESLNRPFGQYFVGQSRPGQWWPESWCTPLAWAVITNKADALRVLLEHGADATVTNPDGGTLYEMATQPGREQVAGVLEEYRGLSHG